MKKKITFLALIFIVVFCLTFVLTVGLHNFTLSDGPNNYEARGIINVTNASVDVLKFKPSDDARCKVNFEIDLKDINWVRVDKFDSLSEHPDKSKIIDFIQSNAGVFEKGQYEDNGWHTSDNVFCLKSEGNSDALKPVFDLKGNFTIKDNKLIFTGEGYNDEDALKDLKDLNPWGRIGFYNEDKNATVDITFNINKEDIKFDNKTNM